VDVPSRRGCVWVSEVYDVEEVFVWWVNFGDKL